MTPKEKARELYIIFFQFVPVEESYAHEYAKQCALIAVEEIMESNSDFAYNTTIWAGNKSYSDSEIYWQEVKTEIEKL